MTDSKIPKDNQTSTDDRDLFREAMQGVRPLKTTNNVEQTHRSEKKYAVAKTHKSYQKPIFRDDYLSRTDTYTDHITETVTGRTELFFARPGLQEKILRMLRRGKLSCQARVDLHGLTVAAARQTVSQFLHTCLRRGHQCVWIIHGKGNMDSNLPPPIKNQVNNWLRQEPHVLAFSSAQPKDGGTGTVYVLLKRQA